MDEQSLSFRLLAILFPIFGIVVAGYFYGRKHKPEMSSCRRWFLQRWPASHST